MRRSLLTASVVVLFGCDLSASGSAGASGTTAPAEGPAKPTYERTFDEFVDVPNQMTAQVEWAAEPIDEAIALADEIAALRAELNIDPAAFAGLFTVAFENGEVEIGAVTEVEETKAKIQATIDKVKAVGQSLQGVPGRIKTATKAIGALAMSTPKLMLKSTKELSGELAAAVGDAGAQIELDIKTSKELPNTIKAEAVEAKNQLAELPKKVTQATTNLMAAIKGESYTPMEKTGSGEATATGDGTVVADAGTGTGTATADAAATGGGTTTTTDAGTGGGTAEAATAPAATGTGAVAIAPAGANPAAAFPPQAVQARITKLQRIAKETGDRGDWKSAADAFEEAYILAPDNLALAYKTGDAAAKAKDCERARAYLERFIQQADPTMFAPELAIGNKTLGELKTFECPPRTPSDEAALAQTLVLEADALGKEGDWGGAATAYAIAYQIDAKTHAHAFQVAVASWQARECNDAATYFAHFASVADPKVNRAQIKETKKYQEEQSASMCPVWEVGEKEMLARDLYAQGQARDMELDFKGAIGKYERAYYLLPTNHALAFRIGESAWKAQMCDRAGQSYTTYVANVDANDARFANDVKVAKANLGKIQSLGCPNALWGGAPAAAGGGGTTVAAGDGGGGGGGGAGDEVPPESGGDGGGSVACSVTDSPRGGAVGLGLLAVLGLLRRRRQA
jgi:MYXO-CTERM domain-containing protein